MRIKYSHRLSHKNKSVRIYQNTLIYSHEFSHRKIARINPVRINCTVHTCENKIYYCEKVYENNLFSQGEPGLKVDFYIQKCLLQALNEKA